MQPPTEPMGFGPPNVEPRRSENPGTCGMPVSRPAIVPAFTTQTSTDLGGLSMKERLRMSARYSKHRRSGAKCQGKCRSAYAACRCNAGESAVS
jgi:hypothetical protein